MPKRSRELLLCALWMYGVRKLDAEMRGDP